ncbi:hypothetical protein [Paenirhodobacter populi]|uniref:hypothetical protein n=1 Tax=Paenirhodobacter populi TaxID=2306993 RepID=UPI000FE4313B|nr:hypothetical protein [Sinirhodobacter populi]
MTKHWSDETGFEPISAAVARLKAKVERAYHESREEDAAAAHDDLVSAEHHLRMAQRQEKTRQRSSAPGDDRQQ